MKVRNENTKVFLATLILTERWSEGKITNFKYLMSLNTLSGRSFNDCTQYPIFPWILKDNESSELDLEFPTVFRDLSKPIGAINEEQLKNLIDKWNKIKDNESNSYLYENCYSNLSIVYYYLISLERFTTQQIEQNSSKLDKPSFKFKSIKETYENATTRDNDYRGLIPEFFYFPEFLENINHLDLGN